METLETWLAALGLGKYADAFRSQEVELSQVPTLTDADLKELGLPLGPRKRILEAAAQRPKPLRADEPAISAAPPAERRQLTIMFVDLVGSTALSGRLDPEDLRTVLRAYHEACAAEISRWGGTVAKLMGDGVLAYFGWPQAQESSAERAIRAGLDINAAVAKLSTPSGEPLAARTGIATGLVVIGDLIGEGAAQEAAIAGETPNLAARLQSSAEPGGLVVSAHTLSLAGAHFETDSLPPLSLKGIAGPVQAYLVKAVRHGLTRFAARGGAEASPLLNRDSELALLQDRFRRASLGDGQVTILTADAGMGKSRLAEAVLSLIDPPPQRRMTWQCAPYHTTTAFHPILPSLQPERLATLEPQERAALARISGQLPLDPGMTAAQARHAAFAAIGAAVAKSGDATRPAILLVEDAHWIDPSTFEALEANIAGWSRKNVFVLITARPSFQADFGGHPNVTTLSLTRLDRRGVAALAAAALGDNAVPAGMLEEIVMRSDGVPLYVEEIARAFRDSGASGVPASLADGLMARLDRLEDAKETAQEASVIGRQFSYDEIAAIASTRPPRLDAALDRLKRSQILLANGDGIGTAYQFKHALLRDAAYDSLLKSRRAALHERFAQTLEHAPSAPVELRALHLEAAGKKTEALAMWRRAGESALSKPAFKEAIAHFRRAQSLAQGIEKLKVETRLGLAAIAAQGHSHPETVAIFDAASQSPHLAQDPAAAFVVWYGLWCGHHVRGEAGRARESAAALHRASVLEGSPANMMMGVRALGITALMNGDVADALARHAEAQTMEDIPRDRGQAQIVGQDQSVSFRSYYGIALWLAGQARRSWSLIEQSIALAREGGHPGSIGYGLTHAILAAIGLGQDAAAQSWTQELLERASEYRLGMWRDYALRFDAIRAVRAIGDDEPMRLAREALDQRSVGLFSAYIDTLTAQALISHNRLDRAELWLDRASRALADGHESWAAPKLLTVRASLMIARGQDIEARTIAAKAAATAQAQGLAAFELEALTLCAHGDIDACGNLAIVVNRLDALPGFPSLAEALAILAQS